MSDVPLKENDHCCITGDTLVYTQSGHVAIRDLVGTNGYIHTYDSSYHSECLKKYSEVRITQEKAKIIKITFMDNNFIKITPDHKILTTNRGWVEAGNILLTDK